MSTTRGALRIVASDLPTVIVELNRILELLQQGGLVQFGLKLDTQTTAVPVDAPTAGQPNLRVVNVAGTHKLYLYNLATGWVVVGTQV